MSTESRLEIALLSAIALILLFCFILILILRSQESLNSIDKAWYAQVVLHKNEDITDEFVTVALNFLDDGRLILPEKKNLKRSGWPLKYATYKYRRSDIVNANIEIEDSLQDFFSGVYEIERKGDNLILFSKEIEMVLFEKSLSVQSTTINY